MKRLRTLLIVAALALAPLGRLPLAHAADAGWEGTDDKVEEIAKDRVRVSGGRYGLGSKEFTPGMARAVFERMTDAAAPIHFTVGITDDVTHMSLPFDADFDLEQPDVRRCVFVGLGADGTVGANKNSIKIIGEQTTRGSSSTTRRSRAR